MGKIVKVASTAIAVVLMSMAQVANAGRDFGAIYVECGLGALIAPSTPWDAPS